MYRIIYFTICFVIFTRVNSSEKDTGMFAQDNKHEYNHNTTISNTKNMINMTHPSVAVKTSITESNFIEETVTSVTKTIEFKNWVRQEIFYNKNRNDEEVKKSLDEFKMARRKTHFITPPFDFDLDKILNRSNNKVETKKYQDTKGLEGDKHTIYNSSEVNNNNDDKKEASSDKGYKEKSMENKVESVHKDIDTKHYEIKTDEQFHGMADHIEHNSIKDTNKTRNENNDTETSTRNNKDNMKPVYQLDDKTNPIMVNSLNSTNKIGNDNDAERSAIIKYSMKNVIENSIESVHMIHDNATKNYKSKTVEQQHSGTKYNNMKNKISTKKSETYKNMRNIIQHKLLRQQKLLQNEIHPKIDKELMKKIMRHKLLIKKKLWNKNQQKVDKLPKKYIRQKLLRNDKKNIGHVNSSEVGRHYKQETKTADKTFKDDMQIINHDSITSPITKDNSTTTPIPEEDIVRRYKAINFYSETPNYALDYVDIMLEDNEEQPLRNEYTQPDEYTNFLTNVEKQTVLMKQLLETLENEYLRQAVSTTTSEFLLIIKQIEENGNNKGPKLLHKGTGTSGPIKAPPEKLNEKNLLYKVDAGPLTTPTTTKKPTATKMSTMTSMIDETEVKNALLNSPFLKRILKLSSIKRKMYFEEKARLKKENTK